LYRMGTCMTIHADRMDETSLNPITCPACGQLVGSEIQVGPMQCPNCGQQFLPAVEANELSSGTESAVSERDDELSELRIRNISNLRRGAYRSRSLLIIAAVICIVAAAKFIQIAIVAVRQRLYLAAIGDAMCAVAAMIGVATLVPRITAFTHEIRGSRLKPPAELPDLSQLGDGSQRWKHLEELSGRDETP
jgi:hypothetical protein